MHVLYQLMLAETAAGLISLL